MKYDIVLGLSIQELISNVELFLSANPTFEATGNPIHSNSSGWMQVVTLEAAIATLTVEDFATEAKQDVLNAKDFATQATLLDVFNKLIAAPSTEAKQDTIIGLLKNQSAQANEGKAFSYSSDFILTSSGINNNVLLIKNPIGSGKITYIQKLIIGTTVTNVSVSAKLFSSPVVTSNGTLKTLTNNRIGSLNVASTLIYQAPITSSSGTQIRGSVNAQNANSTIVSEDSMIILEEGQSVLVTGNPSSNNRNIDFTLTLIEL